MVWCGVVRLLFIAYCYSPLIPPTYCLLLLPVDIADLDKFYHNIPRHTTIYHLPPQTTHPTTRAPQFRSDRPKKPCWSSHGGPILANSDFPYHTKPHKPH